MSSHEEHISLGTYTAVFIALLVLLAVTIWAATIHMGALSFPVAMLIATVKAVLIGAYFMHLKWDKPILRRTFMVGIVLALAVYIITLTAFRFWDAVDVMPK